MKNMLKRTERLKKENAFYSPKFFDTTNETLEEMLTRLGVKKCESRPCTPEKIIPTTGMR